MPAFLEAKLKKQYPHNPNAVYGTMNKLGLMRGNKETPKGRAAQKKHERDYSKPTNVGRMMGYKPSEEDED